MSSFYLTTPIYYVNDAPHLGHAYTTIAADALTRYHRARGDDTWFLTGTDEHGQKIENAAGVKGKQPLQLADEVVERFRATWRKLDIAYDDFIRTTEPRHEAVVADMWRRIAAAGDIYLGGYEGWYCVSCEAFYPETQLLDGRRCPTHQSEASWVAEPSYFFRMAKYQDALLAHFEQHPEFVQPDNYRTEIVSFIKSGLRDLSISRTSFKWGIPVPGDPAHVIYVWLDALTNYIAALGGPGQPAYERHWPGIHLIGKDILRFHAVYWPCFLLSAGLPLPKSIMVHGWWTLRGQKISKSLPATRVDPNQLADDIGLDAVRYFLLREVPLGLDGDFTYESLLGRYNSDLANDLGNLVSRTLTIADKFCAGRVPAAHERFAPVSPHLELAQVAADSARQAAQCFEAFAPSRALEAIWRLVREANRYVDAAQPWALAKDPARRDELDHTVHGALEAIYWAALMVAPVMPTKAEEILGQLGLGRASAAGQLRRWPRAEAFGSELPVDLRLERGPALFPRLDDDRQAALLKKWVPAEVAEPAPSAPVPAAAAAGEPAPADGTVTFAEFGRLDLRVAQIKSAEKVPKTSKLLKVVLDLGGETRQVVAGIAEAYAPEALVGRKVIFLANLKPATIRGVESQGMILAAGDQEILGLSALDRDVPPGTRIR